MQPILWVNDSTLSREPSLYVNIWRQILAYEDVEPWHRYSNGAERANYDIYRRLGAKGSYLPL